MFDHTGSVIGLLPGEGSEVFEAEDRLAFEIARCELADGWSEPDHHVLPDGFDVLPPGPFLAAILGSVDVTRLNGHDLVRVMQARDRLASHHEAGKYQAIAEIAFCPPSDPDSGVERASVEIEYAEVEVAAALTLTRRGSTDLLNRAVWLTHRLGPVWEALYAGLIDLAKVRVFDDLLGHLPGETVDTVLEQVLDQAPEMTTGQLRARLQRLVMVADPDGVASSFQEGLEERKVTTGSNPDLTANLGVCSASPERVAAARSNIEDLARGLRAVPGETRNLDQLRNDVALDLLAGRCACGKASRGAGSTNITIPAETLLGLSNQPAHLEGFGPVVAEIGRKTVYENIDGEWTFTVTDQGQPVATGTLRRRPTKGQQRHMRAVYPTCVHPGCRQPACECDLDHRHQHSRGGKTRNHNLAPLCRYHHRCKDTTSWKLERLENGDHLWTSPLGHKYLRKRGPPD